MKSSPSAFKKTIYAYYEKNRRSFPWRQTTDPYKILVSEVMLQQTQADRVVKKYEAFIERFPTLIDLARAPVSDIISLWQGLGYNRRALALKNAAVDIEKYFDGEMPSDTEELLKLPGVGLATAAGVRAFAFNLAGIYLETNVRTVFLHFFFKDKEGVADRELLPLIEKTVDAKNPRDWYYALLDYGVMLKKKMVNPSRRSAHYKKQSPFKTSNRRVRGLILKAFVEKKKFTQAQLAEYLDIEIERIHKNLITLQKEGFIKKGKGLYIIA